MSALDCLEKVAGISIVNKLAKKFLDNKLTSKLPFSEQIFRMFKNNPVEGSKIMLKTWVSTKGHPPPTWRELMKLFQDNQMGEVVQEIEDYFNKVSATSPSVSLVSSVHVYTSSWYSNFNAPYTELRLFVRYLKTRGKSLTWRWTKLRRKSERLNPITKMWLFKIVVIYSQEMAVQTYEPAAMEITGKLQLYVFLDVVL